MRLQELHEGDLRKLAPSIFAERGYRVGERDENGKRLGVAKSFNFIPTIEVVHKLQDEGFVPTFATQSRCRIDDKREFTKHMLRFSLRTDLETIRKYDGWIEAKMRPEVSQVTLVNAHDGSSCYEVGAGIWVLLCGNGLMTASTEIGSIRVRHAGNIVEEVIQGSFDIINRMPSVFAKIDEWKCKTLTAVQQEAFAHDALALRWNNPEHATPIAAEQLLNARRAEDSSASLWHVFNRVQENMIKGGLRGYSSTERPMRTRSVKSVNEDIRINRALWSLAEEMSHG